MTAEEIRKNIKGFVVRMSTHDATPQNQFLATQTICVGIHEIAAQLADLNEALERMSVRYIKREVEPENYPIAVKHV